MFHTLRHRLLLGVYIFLLLSIPIGAYLASQSQNPNASAKTPSRTVTTTAPSPTTAGLKTLISELTPSPTPSSTPATSENFGPIMDFILYLEGRPTNKQASKVFVGIAEGGITTNPKYLLQFTVDLPNDGRYPNVSLAGLTAGTTYTAYLKGSAQIATASAFIMSAFTTHLNESKPLTALSGDLNEDNTINAADLALAKSGNTAADFNLDGFINSFDLSILQKNLGKTGESGVWQSQPPAPPTGGTSAPSSPTGGYWMWVPDI
jgi:hypothetical protein